MAGRPEEVVPTEVAKELLRVLQKNPRERDFVWELAKYMASSLGVDAYRVFKLFPDQPNYVEFVEPPKAGAQRSRRVEPEQAGRILEVAKTGTCRRLSRVDDSACFPETPVSLFKSFKKDVEQADHVMYQPILAKNQKTAYVIEMWRVKMRFEDIDEQISTNFVVHGSLTLHSCNTYLDKNRESNLSDFLLTAVNAIFKEMVSLDRVIEKILFFTQRLVNADRTSLFLENHTNPELVSTVFDLRFESGHDSDMLKKVIRMSGNRGIAGHVAITGETMNIPDAYSDHRFDREVDEVTGYQTLSILCMPVKLEGLVIAVVQMANKRNFFNFGHEDVAAFEIFSSFFSVALNNARLYDKIKRKEQKYGVALEVLSYHKTCREKEVLELLNYKDPDNVNLNDFYLDPYELNQFDKCKCFVTMFCDLFDIMNFDIITLNRFLLTVRKNYRAVPYHNFDHGWTVAHSMYMILKNDRDNCFNYKMRLAMFVASLCHDLDHSGYINEYTSEINCPMAAMYTTPTLEHKNFYTIIKILQQEGHNIFENVSGEAYKEILGYIKKCIQATDLAAFFPNIAKVQNLFEGKYPLFNWKDQEHQELAMVISMIAADLSASTKPWSIHNKTVQVIFEECYALGDMERATGTEPIPMMDRNKPHHQTLDQKFICVISSDCEMSFGGDSSCPGVVATLESIGNLGLKENKVITKEVTDFVQNELGIAQRHIFLTFYDVKGQDVAQDGKTFAK